MARPPWTDYLGSLALRAIGVRSTIRRKESSSIDVEAIPAPKHNITATTNPGVGDDTADGYDVGSLWVNLSTSRVFLCFDASAGAAVWTGLAQLDSGGKVLTVQIPALAISDVFVVGSEAAQLALTAQVGDFAKRTDTNKTYILAVEPASTFSNWVEIVAEQDPRYTGSVSTLDATPTLILTITDIPDGKVSHFEGVITARRDDGTEGASYHFFVTYRRSGVTTTRIGAPQVNFLAEDDPTWDVDADASGANGRVFVIGAAGKNIDWTLVAERKNLAP